jgi:hypothetical protein
VSLRLPAGKITAIVSAASGVSSADALLRLLWESTSDERVDGSRLGLVKQSGTVHFQGRDLKDWNKGALRARMNYLSAMDETFEIHAGTTRRFLFKKEGFNSICFEHFNPFYFQGRWRGVCLVSQGSR